MHLDYSDDQRATRDAAERFLTERYTAAARRTPGGQWHAFAEMGWLGILVPETYGGLGGTTVDAAILAEAFGRHQVIEPFVSSVVLGGGLIAAAASSGQAASMLPKLMAGSLRVAVAHEETGRSLAAAHVETRCVDGALHGAKIGVLDAGSADVFLVTARTPVGRAGLYLVNASAPGLTVTAFATVDGRMAATLTLTGTPAERVGDDDGDAAAIDRVIDQAIAVLAADMLGAMQGALDATVSYAKMRKQFGQPLAANQVVKHRLVEMAVRCEEARSLALKAAIRASDGSPDALRARAVSGAKVKIAKLARAVTEDAIQLHGAMGVTEELDVGGYLKRALAFEAVLGTSRVHRARYAAHAPAL